MPPVPGINATAPSSVSNVVNTSCAIQAARRSHRHWVQYSISNRGLMALLPIDPGSTGRVITAPTVRRPPPRCRFVRHRVCARTGAGRCMPRDGRWRIPARSRRRSPPGSQGSAGFSTRLRDGRDSHHVADLVDRLDHGAVDRIVRDVAHERAVDLQVIDRQMLEIAERRHAAAEIVERKAATERLQLADQMRRLGRDSRSPLSP